jgi:hypothetical protein
VIQCGVEGDSVFGVLVTKNVTQRLGSQLFQSMKFRMREIHRSPNRGFAAMHTPTSARSHPSIRCEDLLHVSLDLEISYSTTTLEYRLGPEEL